jgi:hypothetical protein
MQATVAQAMARLDTETGPVIILQTELKKVREQLDELTARLAPDTEGSNSAEPAAPRWDGRDPEAEAAQLAELRGWVEEFLRVQYPGYLRSLHPCWPDHREALWELGVLRAEWTRVYGGETAPLADAQWWHERWLPGALGRLKTAMPCDGGGCSLKPPQHRDRAPDFSRTSVDPRIASSFPGRPRPPA